MSEDGYRLFEVCGLELEYPIVDADLRVQPLVEPAFRVLAGRPTSDVEGPRFGFSNELADHVFELKNPRPLPSLATAEADLAAGVRLFSDLLRERFGARLLPGGMHPFMDPRAGRTWRRANRRVYEAYAAIFDLQTHGWMNVQSCHVNLPFGTERETLLMLDATACLIPYLPALAASSPVHDGELGPFVDNRLGFYRSHQARVPETQGRVVPEHVGSFAEYKRDVLGGIYRALRAIPAAAPLRREFCNARGAILRFMRRAMEIRVLDVQECPRADAAIAAFTRAVLRELVLRLEDGRLVRPPDDLLVADFDRVVEQGGQARVEAPHLRTRGGGPAVARGVLEDLLPAASDHVLPDERPYLALVEDRLARGSLAERLRRRLEGFRPGAARRDAIAASFRELADRLDANEPWTG